VTVLAECIPNVSEGRRSHVIDTLAAGFAAYPDVHLLHGHSDADHNRTVFTLIGPPPALLDAVFELYERAVETIDMREQRGVHPRVGAVDVCPFVPLAAHGTTMDDCRGLARRLSMAVADRFGLPVLLYRESAVVDTRRNLAAVRRGQFEGLAERLALPEWAPDLGPAEPHPTAGATIIGARPPLVAFNVVLATDDAAVAREVAAQVRESSGGMPGLRAMGVTLRSRSLAQVSMNIERYDLTPVHEVVSAVVAAAAERGVEVVESELVGLMPRAAAEGHAEGKLLLGQLRETDLLEGAIAAALSARQVRGNR